MEPHALSYATVSAPVPSRAALWTGRILSWLPSLMMLAAASIALIKPTPDMLEGFVKFGYPEHLFRPLIVVELVCVILYLIPQTAVFGAILLTGHFGGAVATHVRLSDPLFPVPAVFSMVLWLGLFLREPRLRALIPLRR